MHGDVVLACVDLVGRAGASGFLIGHLDDDPPGRWFASASYQGTKVFVEEHPSPSGAALALAERLLAGARCKCGQVVTLSDGGVGCRWRLVGARWEPGCDVPPVEVQADRGDLGAMAKALEERRRGSV